MHKKAKFRENCFFCKYEIQKSNKSNNSVKFKNQIKPVCWYCTHKKHKPLEPKHKEIDTQCKKCKKPVLYKNCIACSICDHFYHGKCLNLSRENINKIEGICNFYMCIMCTKTILPIQLDIIPSKCIKKNKVPQLKQCFTCENKITK